MSGGAAASVWRDVRATWPLVLGLAMWFTLIPLMVFWLRDEGFLTEPDATALGALLLLALNPVVVVVVGVVAGFRRGIAWPLAVATGLVWLPAVAVYGASSWPYAPAYAAFALLGLVVGWGLATVVAQARGRRRDRG